MFIHNSEEHADSYETLIIRDDIINFYLLMHMGFKCMFFVSPLYTLEVLCATELLRLSHMIICWSFEFLDVVMEEVLPRHVLSSGT